MNNWADAFFWAKAYQKSALLAAEKERLIRQAMAGRERRPDLLCWALARIGRFLIAWGCALQARYGREAGTPLPPLPSFPGELSGP